MRWSVLKIQGLDVVAKRGITDRQKVLECTSSCASMPEEAHPEELRQKIQKGVE